MSAQCWLCPLCRHPLQLLTSTNTMRCSNGHSFDVAKEGYVNLLPSHKKGSSEPGDSHEMIGARRRIHQADVYQPLIRFMAESLPQYGNPHTILDIGCGEGYYSNAMQQIFPTAQIAALDISKSAIRLAAKTYSAISFSVASAFDAPLASASVGMVVRVFAPSSDEELRRLIIPDGIYVEVTPAADHLWALRAALYDTPRHHPSSRVAIAGFDLLHSSVMEFDTVLEGAALRDLIAMTPFAHRGHREKRDALHQLDSMALKMSFSLNVYRRLID